VELKHDKGKSVISAVNPFESNQSGIETESDNIHLFMALPRLNRTRVELKHVALCAALRSVDV